MIQFSRGDKVILNDNYYIEPHMRGKVFEVSSLPYYVCGTLCVMLKGYHGCYAVDGLTKVEDKSCLPVGILWFPHEECSTEKVPFTSEDEFLARIKEYFVENNTSEGMLIFCSPHNTALHAEITALAMELLDCDITVYKNEGCASS